MIKIIENGHSNYRICYSKNADLCVRYAALELMTYLYKATSCAVGIHSDKCLKRGPEIYIGNARNIKINNASLVNKSAEAFKIYEEDSDLFFIGNSSRAILYAVYRFLEDYIDFRCYASDEIGFNHKDSIVFSDCIEYDFPFEYREVYFRDAFNASYASKNMLNSNMADLSEKYGGKMKWFNFHHSFSDLLSPDEYFDTHPEYFSYIDGVRRKEHTELCLSNPEVFDLCYKKLCSWIEANPNCKVFSVAQDEWMGHFIPLACECDQCKELDSKEGSQSASIINFVNKLAKKVNEKYPDVLIHTFAYQYSRKPPKTLIPNDNVIVRLCNIECSWNEGIKESILNGNKDNISFYHDLEGWSKITNRLYIWDYAVNFRNYLLPFPNLKSMVANIKMYKSLGVKGLLMQGNFSFGGRGYLDELKSFIASRYMRYDNLDFDNEIKDFLNHYYGPYSDICYEYIMLFENHIKDYKLWLYDDSDAAYFNDEIVNKAKDIITKGLNIKSCDKYHKRFNALKLSFDYLYLTRLQHTAKSRSVLLDEFIKEVKNQGITELFERTELDYSFNVIKESRYAKDRPNWVSLYYIMR